MIILLTALASIMFWEFFSEIYLAYKKTGTSFAANDKVEAFGNVGVVKAISKNGLYLEVKFEELGTGVMLFHLDGRLMAWHKVPSLRRL